MSFDAEFYAQSEYICIYSFIQCVGETTEKEITRETTPITIPQKLSRPIRDFFLSTFNIKEKKHNPGWIDRDSHILAEL